MERYGYREDKKNSGIKKEMDMETLRKSDKEGEQSRAEDGVM